MRLPLVLCTVGLALGIGLRHSLEAPFLTFALVVLPVICYWVLTRTIWKVTILCLAFLLGMARYSLDTWHVEEPWMQGQATTIEGTMLGTVTSKGDWSEVRLRVPGVRYAVLVRGTIGEMTTPGARVRVQGVIARPASGTNPGQFDYASFLEARGIRWILNLSHDGFEIVGPSHRWAAVDRARLGFEKSLARILPADILGIYLGLLLGDRSSIDAGLAEGLARAGVGHLLAVSGLHVGFVTAGCLGLTRRLGATKTVSNAAAGCATILYCLLAGASPSVLRATVMALAYIAFSSRGSYDGLSALALASITIMLLRPLSVVEPGFHLSVAATWGILTLAPWLRRLLGGLPSHLATTVSVTLAAQMAVAPLVLRYFGFISLVSLLANPALVPLGGFMVLYGLFLGIAGFVVPLPEFAALPAIWAALALEWGANVFAGFPLATAVAPLPSWGASLAWFVLLTRLPRRRGAVVWGCLTLTLFTLPLATRLAQRHVEITFLDVGQGDAIVLTLPGGRALLVDGGYAEAGGQDAGKRVVLPYLRHKRVTNIDAVFLTHAHQDHIGGLFSVVDSANVRRLYVPNPQMLEPPVPSLIEACTARGIRHKSLHRGDMLRFPGGVSLEVLHPPNAVPGDWGANESSLVLRLIFGRTAFLLTGDLEGPGEEHLLKNAVIASQVLKVGHHGSRNATSERFLEAVKAPYAVISCGKNAFGHPHAETLERLSSAGIRVWITEKCGAITMRSDGNTISVSRFVGDGEQGTISGSVSRLKELVMYFLLG